MLKIFQLVLSIDRNCIISINISIVTSTKADTQADSTYVVDRERRAESTPDTPSQTELKEDTLIVAFAETAATLCCLTILRANSRTAVPYTRRRRRGTER